MKKLKRKRGERIQDYEFTDYAGAKIFTNSKASVRLFGNKEPDSNTVDIISTLITQPDFIFQPLSDPYPTLSYFKCIDGFDYILQTKEGYGMRNGVADQSRLRIDAFKKYPASNDVRRVLFANMKLLLPSLKFFSYSANFYQN